MQSVRVIVMIALSMYVCMYVCVYIHTYIYIYVSAPEERYFSLLQNIQAVSGGQLASYLKNTGVAVRE